MADLSRRLSPVVSIDLVSVDAEQFSLGIVHLVHVRLSVWMWRVLM